MEAPQTRETQQAALQQQQPQHQQTLQDGTAAITEAETRVEDEAAFDSVRQAAVVMFKQRTKDLTRLASVEAESQAIEDELQTAQAGVAQLADQQAALEALVEVEQQRIRQRESRLAEVHGALVQVDEEQRAFRKLQAASEAAVAAASAVIARLTDNDGRLFRLLAQAREKVGGRSARELQTVAAAVEQQLNEATTQQRRLLLNEAEDGVSSSECVDETAGEAQSDVVAAVTEALSSWSAHSAAWSRHPELRRVVEVLGQLASCIAADAPPQTLLPPLEWSPPPLLSEEDFLAAEEGQLQCWVEEHVAAPLQALRIFLDHLVARCAACQMRVPSQLAAALTQLEETATAEWAALLQHQREWRESVAAAERAVSATAAAAQARQTVRVELQTLTEACAALSTATTQRLADLESGTSVELQNYAAARLNAWRTLAAQMATLQEMQHDVAAQESEAADVVARQQQAAEAHSKESAQLAQALQAQQEALTVAQQQLHDAAARKASLEEELAVLHDAERDAQLYRTAMVHMAQAPSSEGAMLTLPSANASEHAVFSSIDATAVTALLTVSGCPAVYAEWASAVEAQKAQLAERPVADAFLEALQPRLAAGGGSSADATTVQSISAALQHVAASLQLPVDVVQTEVVTEELLRQLPCLEVLRAEEQSSRAAAEAHRAFMAEAEAEMALLRQELSATD